MDRVKINKIVRSKRHTVALVVASDATLTVRAPVETSLEYIEELVRRKLRWIEAKIAHVMSRPSTRRLRFVNGESICYLGDFYKLRIVDGAKTPFSFKKEFILDRAYRESARGLLIEWYREQAHTMIAERVRWHARRAGVEVGHVRVTDARKRWGSCSHGNKLNFSWRLILAPLNVVDYVVVHELAHTFERNHSPAFWRHVAVMYPAYRLSVRWLTKNEHSLDV